MMLRGSYRKHQCLSKVILEESDLVTPQNDLKEIVADGEVRFFLVRVPNLYFGSRLGVQYPKNSKIFL